MPAAAWWLLGLGAAVLVAWLVLVAWRGSTIPVPEPPRARPSTTRDEALARLAELQSADDATIADACRTRLIEPSAGEAVATVVVWHGFTNCPAQFAAVADAMAGKGLRVLLARMPRHGVADVLTRSLADLTTAELTEHTDTCIDVATGFGTPVWVMGLSGGGILAAWAAATRTEVSRVLLSAPFVAPKGFPMPVVRLLVRLRRLIPALYFWWDPRKKENLGESPYVYPGFPLPGMVPFLHLGEALFDRRVKCWHELERVTLTTNPGDFAIRRDVARRFVSRVFEESAGTFAEVTLDASLGWWHDFVDPHGPHVGPTEQVTEVFLSALGIARDPSAGGAIVEPLPPQDRDARASDEVRTAAEHPGAYA